jgi:hypothetical protein
MRARLLLLALAGLAVIAAGARAQTYDPYPVALMGGMDKVTGRVSTFTVAVNATHTFGTLEVTARACRKTPPEETPESAGFLEIDDTRESAQGRVFSGWMFASSPGVSALEHPVYDVWLLDCVSEVADQVSSE